SGGETLDARARVRDRRRRDYLLEARRAESTAVPSSTHRKLGNRPEQDNDRAPPAVADDRGTAGSDRGCRSSREGYVAERPMAIALAGWCAAATRSNGRHFCRGAVRGTQSIRLARTPCPAVSAVSTRICADEPACDCAHRRRIRDSPGSSLRCCGITGRCASVPQRL